MGQLVVVWKVLSPVWIWQYGLNTVHLKTDNIDSGHVYNIPDLPCVSTNEMAGLRGVVAENGRIIIQYLRTPL